VFDAACKQAEYLRIPMNTNRSLNIFALLLAATAIGAIGFKNYSGDSGARILNVSYDPTREVYNQINPRFIEKYETETSHRISVDQSHGGSTRQAKTVIDGVAADVVTLALPSDVDMLAIRGLISTDWRTRLPHNSVPYFSTIVFVVRTPNPKQIKDWPDLIKPDVTIITPDPKTSGNGKLSLLAAWGSVIYRGGSESEARAFVRNIYEHVPILGQSARDSSTTFALGKEGDVHLTWENEALREVGESKGELEIVYPPVSILAEPSVAWVDTNVKKHKSEAATRAYVEFLFTDVAQELFARNGYRPANQTILQKHRKRLPDITLFPITTIARDWTDAQEKFFGDDGVYGTLHDIETR
jgi:sulfate/thiosulfate transport system substrate-binding protein